MAAVAFLALLTSQHGLAATAPTGDWIGSYVLRGSDAVGIRFSGSRATIALGAGHATAQTVKVVQTAGDGLTLSIPGAPAPVVFQLRARGAALEGTVRQGRLSGTVRLKRGSASALLARGFYSGTGGELAVVDDPYGPMRLLDPASGSLHGLFPSGAGSFTVGSGWSTRTPVTGRATFGTTATLDGSVLARRPYLTLDVRFASGGQTLAGTLTLPPGRGPHPAVAFVSGSGETLRAYLPDLHALLLSRGVAVLAYDKRGIGQSAGAYPGEFLGFPTIDVLARDAARPSASSAPGPTWTVTASASPDTARQAGSCRSRRRGSPPSAIS